MMDYCFTCLRELDGTPCGCREPRRSHPDPVVEMGRTLADIEAMHVPYRRPHHLPMAPLAKIMRDAALSDLQAGDPCRARAETLERMQRLYDAAREDILATDGAQIVRRCGA